MKPISLLATSFAVLAFGGAAAAQTASDTDESYTAAIRFYHQSLSPESGLYNGIEYIDYARTLQEGTPFFDPVPFGSGSVVYNNMLYENVSIAFDIVKEVVAIYDAAHHYKLILTSKGISRFTTSGHSFIHLTKDSAAAKDMSEGFYEILYDGETKVLKRQTRSVQERLSANGLSEKYILGSSNYFVLKDNVYHGVNNKSALLSLLQNKKELPRWMKKNKLSFSRDKDAALAQSAAWYDRNISVIMR